MNTDQKPKAFDRNRFYTLLSVGKQQLAWDDEFYYGIWLPMQGASLKDGRYSATTLSNTQLFQALETMKQSGFKIKPKAKGKGQRALADDAQSRMIRALWLELHRLGAVRDPSEGALAGFVKRQHKIDALQWISSDQASRVIEALKSWVKRTEAKKAGEADETA